MRKLVPLLALAAFAAAPAHAALYSTSFTGTVTKQVASGLAVGSTIAGSFQYSSDANRFLSFNIGSFSATQPFTSTATTSPANVINPYEAIYSALTSATQTGGNVNRGFTLDLLALNTFSSGNALSVLTSGTPLETQANSFDGNFSSFSFYNGTGTNVTQSLTAALNASSLTTSVPEPISLALLAAPVFGVVLRRRR